MMGVAGSRRPAPFDQAGAASEAESTSTVVLPPPPASTTPPSVPSSLLKPPKERNLVLKTLIADAWERILSQLPTKDILSFMLTCSEAREIAMFFVGHFVTSDGRLQRLEALFAPPGPSDTTRMPLLLSEKALRLKLEKLRRNGVDKPTLIHFKAVTMLVKIQDCLRRENVFNADHFPHLGNPHYILRVFDDQLDRDIVRLDTVCWLQFHKTFSDVGPGRYEVSLRMRLSRNFHWPTMEANHPTYIEAKRLEDDGKTWTELSSQAVSTECWSSIQRRRFDPRRLNATIRFDGLGDANNWFWFILPQFHLPRQSSVLFQFRDIENPFWKSGMEWDFIQLQKLE